MCKKCDENRPSNKEFLEFLDEGDLGDIIVDMKCMEASDINNSGMDEQIEYILGL